MITVSLNGTTSTRNFQPGQKVHISGTVRGSFGLPEPIPIIISVQVGGQAVYANAYSSVLGNFGADITMPNTSGTGTIEVTAEWLFDSPESQTIPISVGNVAAPPYDPGKGDGSINTTTLALIAGAILLGIIVIKKI